MNTETRLPEITTAGANSQADADRGNGEFDAAAAHARAGITSRPRRLQTVVIPLAVGAVAFFVGSRWASNGTGGVAASGSVASSSATAGESEKQLWTCSMHPQVIQDKPGICPICHMELTPLKGSSGSDAGAVKIDPVIVQNMGVRTATATREPLVQSVRAVGYLEEPAPLHRDVNLRVSGWIEKLYANIDGMAIAKGMPLFDLYSPELAVAIDELIAANKQAEQSVGDANALSFVETGRRKLAQYGLEPAQIDALAKMDAAPATVSFLSPLDGHLTEKMVYEGASVKAGDLVMRLANRNRMWIDAQVHEQQMSLVSDGQPVQATVVSQPGRTFTGKVLFVHPHVDPQTRTALARIEIDNSDMTLRQGMYATVDIAADAYREATVVPREAVIDTGRRQLVFVSLGEGRFAPRDVRLGLPGQNDAVEVLEGLQPGDEVVTSGQFLLDTESRLKEAVAKHLSAGLPGHAAHAEAPVNALAEAGAASQPAALVAVPHADDIMRDYLALAEKFGARQEKDEPADASALVKTASMAAEHAETDEAKALAVGIADAAKALVDKPLVEQRKAFVGLSNAAITFARHAQLTPKAAETLYVMHCPMAFDDTGADWLQDEESIKNPYYATQMKRCGEVKDTIAVKK